MEAVESQTTLRMRRANSARHSTWPLRLISHTVCRRQASSEDPRAMRLIISQLYIPVDRVPLLAWRRQTVWQINRRGQVLWRAEFARHIRSVVCSSTGFHVLAGAIY